MTQGKTRKYKEPCFAKQGYPMINPLSLTSRLAKPTQGNTRKYKEIQGNTRNACVMGKSLCDLWVNPCSKSWCVLHSRLCFGSLCVVDFEVSFVFCSAMFFVRQKPLCDLRVNPCTKPLCNPRPQTANRAR